VLEAAGGSAGACEDGSTVTVLVGVDHLNCLIDGLDVETDKNGTEDFLSVALHVGLHVGDDGRANLENMSVKNTSNRENRPTQLPLAYFSEGGF
jgi:hypothetical protein